MKKIICNPLNLEYRYQVRKNGKIPEMFAAFMPETTEADPGCVYREAADPTMVLFKDTYLLFASMSGGFWYSDDLCDWKFKETPELPIYDYAPDVRQIGDSIVFSASKAEEPCTFFRSEDPLNKPFEAVCTPFPFHDPDIFQDDDGRVYFYWGCSSTDPIYGLEVDPVTLMPLCEKVAMFGANDEHGWERPGDNNLLSEPKTPQEKMIREYMGAAKPFIEGAFMTKHNGMYYLQYSGPGTEYNVYSDGVYVGDSPLGPFTYQCHNPFSSKPGGFITAAGHGSTFEDKQGNWWHISTMRISINNPFERRIGLFPCFFDDDGLMYCNQNFADYPLLMPQGKQTNQTQPYWMLLSYGKSATASSFQPGHEPDKGTDEDVRTWWAAESKSDDQWYQLDLGDSMGVCAVQVNIADYQCTVPDISIENMRNENMGISYRQIDVQPKRTEYLLECSSNGVDWVSLVDRRNAGTDYSHDFIVFEETVKTRYLRVSGIQLPFDAVPNLSGLRVFGNGHWLKPGKVDTVECNREDGMNIYLKWQQVGKAIGYNVRYGTAPDKLYSSWQLYDQTELRLSMVNLNTSYYIAVDSFNESGVTEGAVVFVK